MGYSAERGYLVSTLLGIYKGLLVHQVVHPALRIQEARNEKLTQGSLKLLLTKWKIPRSAYLRIIENRDDKKNNLVWHTACKENSRKWLERLQTS
jgi:hypothetical protein